MSPVFSPPTVDDGPAVDFDKKEMEENPLGYRLFRHSRGRTRGRTVLKAADGTYTTVDTPTQDQVDAAAVAYMGGRVYQITAAEAASLTAAGYGSNIN